MADETTPAVSPTGTPLVPTKAVPWILIVVAVAGAVVGLPEMGVAIPAIVLAGAKVVGVIGAALGIASPGLRK
jgi:hypothetical protein